MLLPGDEDEDVDDGKVLIQGLRFDGDLEEGMALKTHLSHVTSDTSPTGSIPKPMLLIQTL